MPPKAKIKREEIIAKAFDILRVEGFEPITARRLANELDCSTQPIYYIFDNMEDLKKELYVKAKKYFEQCVMDMKDKANPELDFLEMGLAYIKYAKKEHHVFMFLCMGNNFALNEIAELTSGAKLSKEQADIFLNMWIYTHGIACIIMNNEVPIQEEEIKRRLMKAYKGFKSQY